MKTSMDRHGRYRNTIVAFRVSPEESEMINRMVKISGLTKQDYILKRLEYKDVEVIGNPKVYIGLKRLLEDLLVELKDNNEKVVPPKPETQETIRIVANVLNDMKDEERK